jgi:uncharacterized protein GlcG (DUF336 family)
MTHVRSILTALHLALLALLTGSVVVSAQGVLPTQPYLPLDLALTTASAALAQCETDGYRVTVAVVDRSGVIKVLLRADGAGPHTVGSSTRKAYTSASLGRPTGELAATVAGNAELEGMRHMDPQIILLAGGLPIVVEDVVVGGIGVGGAPGGNLDEACAQVGIDALMAALTEMDEEPGEEPGGEAAAATPEAPVETPAEATRAAEAEGDAEATATPQP